MASKQSPLPLVSAWRRKPGPLPCFSFSRRTRYAGLRREAACGGGLLLVQLENGHKGLGGELHAVQRAHLLFARPTKGMAFCGDPMKDFTCSAEVNSACAKVLGRWPKTLARRVTRRPAMRVPRGQKKLLFCYSSSSLRTAINASVGSWTEPRLRIFFLPSFCFSSSFFLRVMSPP